MSRARNALIFAAAGVGLATLDALVKPSTRPRRRRQLSGMASEEPIDEPPVGLIYDNRPPCQMPVTEHPWSVQPNPAPPASMRMLNPNGDEDVGYCIPPTDLEPKVKTDVPWAEGGPRPQWPIRTADEDKVQVSYQDVRNMWHGKWGRHFVTGRKGDSGKKHHHAGVDLFADPGDVVQAMEDGEIIAILPFHHGSYAIYVKNDSGIIVNYGEVKKNSWWDYGIQSGIGTKQRVHAGQPLAKIGVMSGGSSMLHVETYKGDTTVDEIRNRELTWPWKEPPPKQLLDPTRYLVRAQRVWFESKMNDEAA